MKDITDKEFALIRDFIKEKFGTSLSDEKKSLVYSRLRTTLQDLGLNDFTEYYKYLTNDKSGKAVTNFINKITTNHTYFMREADHFDYLRDTVFPYIEQTYKSKRDLRLWCAGCSSGEEAYTLQILAQEYFQKFSDKWDTKMLATDISTAVLDKAVNGVYATESINTLPEKWRKEYFKKYDSDHSIVTDQIKNQILFRRLNFVEGSFPFKKPFQVIFCRNVMIYMDNNTRDDLVKKFYDITESGGYLFIGHSESLNHTDTKYKYIMPAVYRKV